jgi:hypothetical protein
MKKTISFLFFLSTFYVLFEACGNKTADDGQANSFYISAADCTGSTPTYTADVKPILDTKCANSGCHSAVSPAHALDLSTYATTKAQFNVHTILCSINQDGTCGKMPNNGTKLAAADIKKITCWAKNNFPQ